LAYLFISQPKAWWRYRTCDLQVAGSSPASTPLRSGLMGKLENIRHSFPTLSLSISLHNYSNISLSILFLFLQFSMTVFIYLLFTVLSFIWTVFLHVLNMLFGLMTTRLNKRYTTTTTAYTCVPLSPSSITSYWSKVGDALGLGK